MVMCAVMRHPPMAMCTPDITISAPPMHGDRVMVFVPDQLLVRVFVILVPAGIANKVIDPIHHIVEFQIDWTVVVMMRLFGVTKTATVSLGNGVIRVIVNFVFSHCR
jgi:hypothetical protein